MCLADTLVCLCLCVRRYPRSIASERARGLERPQQRQSALATARLLGGQMMTTTRQQ